MEDQSTARTRLWTAAVNKQASFGNTTASELAPAHQQSGALGAPSQPSRSPPIQNHTLTSAQPQLAQGAASTAAPASSSPALTKRKRATPIAEIPSRSGAAGFLGAAKSSGVSHTLATHGDADMSRSPATVVLGARLPTDIAPVRDAQDPARVTSSASFHVVEENSFIRLGVQQQQQSQHQQGHRSHHENTSGRRPHQQQSHTSRARSRRNEHRNSANDRSIRQRHHRVVPSLRSVASGLLGMDDTQHHGARHGKSEHASATHGDAEGATQTVSTTSRSNRRSTRAAAMAVTDGRGGAASPQPSEQQSAGRSRNRRQQAQSKRSGDPKNESATAAVTGHTELQGSGSQPAPPQTETATASRGSPQQKRPLNRGLRLRTRPRSQQGAGLVHTAPGSPADSFTHSSSGGTLTPPVVVIDDLMPTTPEPQPRRDAGQGASLVQIVANEASGERPRSPVRTHPDDVHMPRITASTSLNVITNCDDRDSIDSDDHIVLRQDSLFSRARRVLSGPGGQADRHQPTSTGPQQSSAQNTSGSSHKQTRHSHAAVHGMQHVDADPVRGLNARAGADGTKPTLPGPGDTPQWAVSYEARIRMLESELAAARLEGARMADLVHRLEEENAQTRGAVPALEDVISTARQHFDVKERALKRTIEQLHVELKRSRDEKQRAMRLLSRFSRAGGVSQGSLLRSSAKSDRAGAPFVRRASHKTRLHTAPDTFFDEPASTSRLDELESMMSPSELLFEDDGMR